MTAPSPAQKAARARNWRIRCLRALYAQAHMLTGERRERAQQAIDDEIALTGAETQAQRRLAALCHEEF